MDDKENTKDPLYRTKNLVKLIASEPNYSILHEEAQKEHAKLAKMPVVMGARMHMCHGHYNGSRGLHDNFPRDTVLSGNNMDYFLRIAASEAAEMLGVPPFLHILHALRAEADFGGFESCYLETETPPRILIFEGDLTKHVMPPTMFHEYAHFLQDVKSREVFAARNERRIDDFVWNFKPMNEGFARGVERIIAERYAAEKDDRLYLVRTQERICADIDNFFNKVVPEQKADWKNRFVSFDGHWGTVAFLVLERKFGREIYGEFIHSESPYEDILRKLERK